MNWKRVWATAMAGMLAFSLVACGDDTEEAANTDAPSAASNGQQNSVGGGNEGSRTSGERRDYYTRSKGGGEDVYTLMIYMCGSDLESETGAATDDINEILYAEHAENLNIIVETGGASEWHNTVIPSDTNMRWKAGENGFDELEDVGMRDMTDPETLADFIAWTAEEYPADRYGLIMWDHGGGTLGGFASDENYPDSEAMTIIEMNQAFNEAGVLFDFIGFDACLMATAETAYMLDNYADYMIASQRTEPGGGWYYTDWVSELSADTSMDTETLGEMIAESYKEANVDDWMGEELTLSVIDLTYIQDLFASLNDYFSTAQAALVNDRQFMEVSKARYDSRDLSGNNEQVDIAYLVENMSMGELSDEVMANLDACVAYNMNTIDNHNGLCVYFPYEDLSKVQDAMDIYSEIGIDESYQDFITTFATLMVGGQAYSEGGSGGALDESIFTEAWVDDSLIDEYEDYYDENSYSDELEIIDKGDYYALSMSDEDWDIVTAYELNLFLTTEFGDIDMGSDNVWEFDEDGDLMVNFDYTWVALDGNIIPFYAEAEMGDDDEWQSYGYSPCAVNGTEAELVLVWDQDTPSGYVAGYRMIHGELAQKGLIELKAGDELQFFVDVYVYDEDAEEYNIESGHLWEEITCTGNPEVSYEDIGDIDCEIYYSLYDIYQNIYWTESVYFTD